MKLPKTGRAARATPTQIALGQLSEDVARVDGHALKLIENFETMMQAFRENNTKHDRQYEALEKRVAALEKAKG
jgi:hypothetical protein